MHRSRLVTLPLLVTLALLLGACSTDVTQSDEYLDLQQQLADLAADYEALAMDASLASTRHHRAAEILEELATLLADPSTAGSRDDVADLIATHATEDAVMDDVVFGAYPYREAFYNTLYFGGADAGIDVYDWWVSDDGSVGGSLWMWSGTNPHGHPFELAGFSYHEFADDGRIAYELVTYPYPAEYVREAWLGGGTPVPSTR